MQYSASLNTSAFSRVGTTARHGVSLHSREGVADEKLVAIIFRIVAHVSYASCTLLKQKRLCLVSREIVEQA